MGAGNQETTGKEPIGGIGVRKLTKKLASGNIRSPFGHKRYMTCGFEKNLKSISKLWSAME